jgi:pSer/pThr/pTyr-binding forkhead associated (FHA) protein
VLLGRGGDSPAATSLARHDNVSRSHATVSVTSAGQASVRDEHSTNGTFVNGQRADPGQDLPLLDGDTLRLASDVAATVHHGSAR